MQSQKETGDSRRLRSLSLRRQTCNVEVQSDGLRIMGKTPSHRVRIEHILPPAYTPWLPSVRDDRGDRSAR
jgi:hypothetical protein